MTTTTATRDTPRARTGFVNDLVRRGAAVWIIVALFAATLTVMRGGALWTTGNLAALLTSAVVLGLVALGQHVVILSGGIDLSIGSLVTLITLCTAVFINGYPIRTAPVIIGVLILGGLLGAVNGVLVARLGMPPFIVTLGTLYLFNGIALLISSTPAGQVTSVLSRMAIGRIGPLPYIFFLLLFAVLLVWALLNRTAWGRHVTAVGGDLEAARSVGIDVDRVRIKAFLLAGVLAALAGIILAARSGLGSPTAGEGLELSAITVVVLGGASLLGGRGALLGTMGGVALLSLITNSITILQFPSTITDLIRGVIIIAAAAIFVAKTRK
ncbi:ABC transporter permease [Pseudactinotalea sp. Z1739]|uniref:ABC transporter permease n=1 Tax=Pseudactinotalea sp. Z1739 TaxID=3413028 RepID=UPI003C7D94A4